MSKTNTPNKPQKQHLINEEIKVSPVLLVVGEGNNRMVELEEALQEAKSQELDLVLINENAKVPIVKILDYGKFSYEIRKKQKKHNSSNRAVAKIKSITVKPQISEHDIGWKANKAIEWLKGGERVQFVVKAPGRMCERMDLINEVYESFVKLVEDYGKPRENLKKMSKIQYITYFMPTGK